MERQGALWRCAETQGGCGYVCSVDELEPNLGCPFCGRGATARPGAMDSRPRRSANPQVPDWLVA